MITATPKNELPVHQGGKANGAHTDDGSPAFESFIKERLKLAEDKTNRIPLDEAFRQIRANVWG